VTEEFLEFTKAHGNDLSTPRPPSFPGLKPGDRWCLCVSRYPHILNARRTHLFGSPVCDKARQPLHTHVGELGTQVTTYSLDSCGNTRKAAWAERLAARHVRETACGPGGRRLRTPARRRRWSWPPRTSVRCRQSRWTC